MTGPFSQQICLPSQWNGNTELTNSRMRHWCTAKQRVTRVSFLYQSAGTASASILWHSLYGTAGLYCMFILADTGHHYSLAHHPAHAKLRVSAWLQCIPAAIVGLVSCKKMLNWRQRSLLHYLLWRTVVALIPENWILYHLVCAYICSLSLIHIWRCRRRG